MENSDRRRRPFIPPHSSSNPTQDKGKSKSDDPDPLSMPAFQVGRPSLLPRIRPNPYQALSSHSDSKVILGKKRKLTEVDAHPLPVPPVSTQALSSQSNSQISSSSSSDSESEEYIDELLVHEARNVMSFASMGAILCCHYFDKYLSKQPPRYSRCSGWQWLMEIISTPSECYRMLRMEPEVFFSLSELLITHYGLKSTRAMRAEEALAIFIYACAHHQTNRQLQNRFKHSGETISRKFSEVLNVMTRFSKDIVKPLDPYFREVPSQIQNNYKYWPHFKGCIGAMDGTHVSAVVPDEDKVPYIGRKGYPSQNVLAICDFDMLFTYFVAGWPGSVHDNRILKDALEDPKKAFPHPPEGKYYVVDAGYPNMKGYLAPFKGQKYHIPDYKRSREPATGFYEVFNYTHSSLRNVIERTFSVWKGRWPILKNMPNFSLDMQNKVVGATMAMHNYIRRHAREDIEFDKCDANPDYMPKVDNRGGTTSDYGMGYDGLMDDSDMAYLRDQIAASLMKNT